MFSPTPFKIRFIDIFGIRPSIGYKQFETSSTRCGKITTILMYLLFISSVLYFGKDIVLRREPLVTRYENQQMNSKGIALNTSNLIKLDLVYPSNVTYDYDFERLFDLKSFYLKYENNSLPYVKEINIVPCPDGILFAPVNDTPSIQHPSNGNQFYEFLNQIQNPIQTIHGRCLENTDLVEIQSKIRDNVSGGDINVWMADCNNQTQGKNNCHPQESIDKIKKLGSMLFSFVKTEIDPTNKKNMANTFYQSTMIKISSLFTNMVDVIVNPVSLTIDNGIIFDDKKTEQYITSSQIWMSSYPKEELFNQSMVLRVSIGNSNFIYEIRYLKLQEVIAQVWGVYSLFLILAIFFLKRYTIHKYYEELATDLFDFDANEFNDDTKKKLSKNSESMDSIEQQLNNNNGGNSQFHRLQSTKDIGKYRQTKTNIDIEGLNDEESNSRNISSTVKKLQDPNSCEVDLEQQQKQMSHDQGQNFTNRQQEVNQFIIPSNRKHEGIPDKKLSNDQNSGRLPTNTMHINQINTNPIDSLLSDTSQEIKNDHNIVDNIDSIDSRYIPSQQLGQSQETIPSQQYIPSKQNINGNDIKNIQLQNQMDKDHSDSSYDDDQEPKLKIHNISQHSMDSPNIIQLKNVIPEFQSQFNLQNPQVIKSNRSSFYQSPQYQQDAIKAPNQDPPINQYQIPYQGKNNPSLEADEEEEEDKREANVNKSYKQDEGESIQLGSKHESEALKQPEPQQMGNKSLIRKGIKKIERKIPEFKIGFFEWIISVICPKYNKKESLKQQLIVKSKMKLIEETDVAFILQKLRDIDKLKAILMNDDQRKLFDILPRPILTLKDTSVHKERLSKMFTGTHFLALGGKSERSVQNIQAEKHYLKIKQQNNQKSDLEYRLLKMYEDLAEGYI